MKMCANSYTQFVRPSFLGRSWRILALILLIAIAGQAQVSDSLQTALANATTTIDSIRILNELAAAVLESEPLDALQYSQQALQSSQRIDYTLGIAISLIRLGQYAHGEHEQEQAQKYYTEALSNIDENAHPLVAAEAYTMLGRVLTDTAQKRSLSIEAAQHALRIYMRLGDKDQTAVLANSIGYRFWRLAQYDSALVYYNQALELRKQLQQIRELAQTTNNLGVVYYNTGNYELALEYYLQARQLQQKRGNKYSLSLVLSNIGRAYQDWGRPMEAMRHFQEALAEGRSIDDNTAMGYANNNIGNLYESIGKYDSALVSYELSLENYTREIHNEGIILNYNSIGHNYINLKNYAQAINFLDRAITASDSIEHPFGKITALKHIGEVHALLGEYEQALEDYHQGLVTSQKIGQRDVLKDIYGGIAHVYDESGQPDSALIYFKNYEALKDSLYSEQTARNINSLKIRYQTEKNERENAALRNQEQQQKAIIERNKIIILVITALLVFTIFFIFLLFRLNQARKQNITLLSQSEEKYRHLSQELAESDSLRELLLDIITHDLKNPAGVIYGMGMLAMEDSPENKLLPTIVSSSERLLAVLNNTTVLTQAAFGEAIPKETLNLYVMLSGIVEDHAAILDDANMELELAVSPDILINANPIIAEVFKNYISNALKYAREGNRIIVGSSMENQRILVFVKDFGTTIQEQDREIIFTRQAQLDGGKSRGRGLGLAIVKRIATAHNGSVWVEANTPQGNIFWLSLPR